MREEAQASFLIEVDGGIKSFNAAQAVAAGADVLVAGSADLRGAGLRRRHPARCAVGRLERAAGRAPLVHPGRCGRGIAPVGNTFGTLFRVTTWGESHGGAIGAVVDGCPPQLPLSEADIQPDLDRRAPGQSHLVTQRKESDTVRILSGVFEGQTLGTPIGLLIPNEDARSGDYAEVATKYRPSHADYTYDAKYGIRDWRGGGRTSARETAARVAAGAIARKLLAVRWGVEIVAFVSKVGRLVARADLERVTRADVERTPIRCPDPGAGRGDDRGRRGRAQGRQLAGRRRHVRGARLPAGLGRAGVRSPRGRPGARP